MYLHQLKNGKIYFYFMFTVNDLHGHYKLAMNYRRSEAGAVYPRNNLGPVRRPRWTLGAAEKLIQAVSLSGSLKKERTERR